MVAFTRHGAGERAESFLHLDFQTARRESDFSNKAIPLNSATVCGFTEAALIQITTNFIWK